MPSPRKGLLLCSKSTPPKTIHLLEKEEIMPLPTSKLTKTSSKAATRAAISACIRQEIKAGYPQDQALAMCLNDARKHAGSRFIPRKVSVK